ncbi:HNH endonuclease signature motif containing protein [Paraclostridium sordellii]|uniref:HNH endonuclease signature motif containing protein n=1 Tax=Paraclostridium sordellii TaxID=1505 RepID=UPI0005E859D0|nr:HNH endonuclease signature motif containing protein [Paeniclostridium sordellii]CEN94317.1 Uncharacterised protein [[Clostridium] sordellii] [Paeniclostridium sordellii]CEN94659.1 Uncharacterised protein [[Clostridium] sordellii] [Paeniclostridium sordellii]
MKKTNNEKVTTTKGLNSQHTESVYSKKVSEIKGLEKFDNYIIYSDGRLFNTKTNRFLKGSKTEYIDYSLSNGLHKKYISAHRLVALAFVDGYFEGAEVDHIEPYRISKNNNYTNLRWVSKEENRKKSLRPKTTKRRFIIAEKINAKETPKLFTSIASAAKELNISKSGVYKCCYGIRHTSGGYKFTFAER